MREIRDKKPVLFEKIKRLPKKARVAREYPINANSLVTYFRSGNLRKMYQTLNMEPIELDFFETAEILKAKPETRSYKISSDFYKHLNINKHEFDKVFEVEYDEPIRKGGPSQAKRISKIIQATLRLQKGFTELDEDYLKNILKMLDEGTLPPVILKNIKKELDNIDGNPDPFIILAKIKANIPEEYFEDTEK